MKNESSNATNKFIKIIYFDESSAGDYNDLKFGGQIDWSTENNKEKLAKIIGEIDGQVKFGNQLVPFIKAMFSGKITSELDYNTKKIVNSTITNTILTDFINFAEKDSNIIKIESSYVQAPENSVTMYRMYSSYLSIVPSEELPINLDGLNNAILGERGYYQMTTFVDKEEVVLRFNINTFKNSYTLADLPKMKLTYYAIKVGSTKKENLSLDKEFEIKNEKKLPNADSIISGIEETKIKSILPVYDVILAGVKEEL